jgi:hypothetical protein
MLAREPIDEQEGPVMSSRAAIVAGRREAGDSFDFDARYGRALQARAARESMQGLLTLFRSRRRRAAAARGWRVDWPTGPRASHTGRP